MDEVLTLVYAYEARSAAGVYVDEPSRGVVHFDVSSGVAIADCYGSVTADDKPEAENLEALHVARGGIGLDIAISSDVRRGEMPHALRLGLWLVSDALCPTSRQQYGQEDSTHTVKNTTTAGFIQWP